jgi:mandelate racemase
MNPTIEVIGLRVRPLIVPLRRPLATSFGTFTEGPFLAVEIHCKGGITGRLIGFTFHRLGLKLVPAVLEHLTTFAKGRPINFHDIGAIHDACQKSLMLLGHEGVTQMALSMFDMALHDALAQAAGVPLWKLLGGKPDSIPSYNSCGLGLLAAADAASQARELAAEHGGFAHIKMRLGRPTIALDIAAIEAVKHAIGPGVALSVDFNQALPSATALESCRAIDNLGLTWIEEPVTFDDYETQARLAAKLATPLQVGETWWHWRAANRAMAMHACDFIMPDILRIGGVTGWQRTARAAELAAVPFSSHLSPEYSAHLLAATPTAHWLEYMDWAQELITDPVTPSKGFATPKSTPGAGITFNEAAIAKCVVAV